MKVNDAQLEDKLLAVMQDMAAIKESLKSAHKRIDENDALTAQIHKLATNIELLAAQLKTQNERMEQIINTFEGRLKTQGERIGSLEGKYTELEHKPAKKLERRWDGIIGQVITFIIGAILVFVAARFGVM